MHLIRNASANITTDWFSTANISPGDYSLSGSGTFGGGTLRLQFGQRLANGTIQVCPNDAGLAVTATSPVVIVTITPGIYFRGEFTGSSGASAVNLWLS